MYRTIALAAAVLTLAGCGGQAATNAAPTTTAPAATAPTAGCTAEKTEELYVSELYTCAGRATSVYTFASQTARDNWRKAAEQVGSVVVGQGDTWLEVKA